MKNIKYFLLFVIALCVSQQNNLRREPQRVFGPRIPNNQNNGFGSNFPNNRFDSSFSNNPNNEFDSRFLNSIGLGPRFTNQKNGPISQNQNTYLQPKENQLNLNAQSEQAIEAEFMFLELWILIENIYNHMNNNCKLYSILFLNN